MRPGDPNRDREADIHRLAQIRFGGKFQARHIDLTAVKLCTNRAAATGGIGARTQKVGIGVVEGNRFDRPETVLIA